MFIQFILLLQLRSFWLGRYLCDRMRPPVVGEMHSKSVEQGWSTDQSYTHVPSFPYVGVAFFLALQISWADRFDSSYHRFQIGQFFSFVHYDCHELLLLSHYKLWFESCELIAWMVTLWDAHIILGIPMTMTKRYMPCFCTMAHTHIQIIYI